MFSNKLPYIYQKTYRSYQPEFLSIYLRHPKRSYSKNERSDQ